MDVSRYSLPAFLASFLACALVGFQLYLGGAEASELRRIEERLAKLESRLHALSNAVGAAPDATELAAAAADMELHGVDEARRLVAGLGAAPTAEQLAEKLADLDCWIATAEDVDALQRFKLEQVAALRKVVKSELSSLHEKSVAAKTGREAADHYARASQALALYPMDSSKEVLAEARAMSAAHSDVGSRIERVGRLRYNSWAMERIEATIKAVNENASSFSTADNPKTIDATVKQLGEVDPALLEPIVLQLYTQAIEQAKSNINAEEQIQLGRRLLSPKNDRKSYGDF